MKRIITDIVLESRIKQVLKQKGIRSKALSEITGVSQESISKIINDRYKSIDLKMVTILANALDSSISDIYNTGCIQDENNRIILELLKSVIKDIKNNFEKNELDFLKDLLNNDIIEAYSQFQKKPSNDNNNTQFLSFIVLDSYYTNRSLTVKHDINLTNLVDKINNLSELECLSIIYKLIK